MTEPLKPPPFVMLGRSPEYPLPTTQWPDDNPPASWWGRDANGTLTKCYRSYEDYVDD